MFVLEVSVFAAVVIAVCAAAPRMRDTCQWTQRRRCPFTVSDCIAHELYGEEQS